MIEIVAHAATMVLTLTFLGYVVALMLAATIRDLSSLVEDGHVDQRKPSPHGGRTPETPKDGELQGD